MIRCEIPVPNVGKSQRGEKSILDTFVATNLTPGALPTSPEPTDLTRDWRTIPPPQTLLLKFPGTAGRAERSSAFPANLVPPHDDNRYHDLGNHYEAWTWNPPGYGRSSGRATLKSFAPAAETFASQVLEARFAPNTQVWICGNSLGCLPALSLAARLDQWRPNDVAKDRFSLWLRNPPHLSDVVLGVADRYAARRLMKPVISRIPDSLHAIESASRSQIPAVFLMSERDELVLPTIQQKIHAAYAGEHRIVTLADLDHGGLIDEQHREEVERAAKWLASLHV
ncbi:alpha/beta hydrolase [Aporhodopirellula aestuarii]|uniref:Alpha/beta hydrolase n=1 Tax=Aporhodopirellula aestuarii TaxID=2950107 RepID=A0ABT0U1Q6_9BACT|nr:alpha/beta fold hydrolase [Aporhodopirellula aestuarii]MCM2370835.1 alpha/beta hydrolase [Aporhodopirellula aestuarii]